MKKSHIIEGIIIASFTIGLAAFALKDNTYFLTNAEEETYELKIEVIDADATSSNPTSGTHVAYTNNGNPIKWNYTNYYSWGATKVNHISPGGYLELDSTTPLGTISSIRFENPYTSCSMYIYSGWYEESTSTIDYQEQKSFHVEKNSSNICNFTKNKPNYLKIVPSSSYVEFTKCYITYNCAQSQSPFGIVDGCKLQYFEDHASIVKYVGDKKDVVLPTTSRGLPITTVESGAFADIKIDTLLIPSSYTTIETNAFENCGLKDVVFSEGLESIKNSSFRLNNLTQVTIPDSVTYIGSSAFALNSDLNSFILSDASNLLELGQTVFDESQLTSFHITKKLRYTNQSFNGLSNLSTFTVDNENEYYSVENDILYNKDKTELVKYPNKKTNTTYIMPNSVKKVGHQALGNENIENLTFSNNLETFGEYNEMPNLKTVNFNNWKVKRLCNAFFKCLVTEITLPEGLERIEGQAFWWNEKLKTVNLPSTITYVEYNRPFADCRVLDTFNFAGTMEQWKATGKLKFEHDVSLYFINCSDGKIGGLIKD